MAFTRVLFTTPNIALYWKYNNTNNRCRLQVEKPYYAVQLIRYSTHVGLRMCKHLRYVRCAYDASINMHTTNMYTVISPQLVREYATNTIYCLSLLYISGYSSCLTNFILQQISLLPFWLWKKNYPFEIKIKENTFAKNIGRGAFSHPLGPYFGHSLC